MSKKIKARLIAQRYTQVEGIEYNEVFSPVVKYNSIRLLISFVANFDMHLEQIEIKTTLLHGELEEKIYMKQLSIHL